MSSRAKNDSSTLDLRPQPPAKLQALAEPPAADYTQAMTKVENLEREIEALSDDELSEFRRWYSEFDAATWDREFASDVRAGALDGLADEAIADHRAGRSRPR